MAKNFLRVFIVLLGVVFPGFAKEGNVLKVGMELNYPPFETIDKDGNPAGLSVDMAKLLGAYLNKTTEIVNIAFVGLIPALKSSKIDLIISSMSITREREKSIDFSDPYLRVGLCLLVQKDSTIKDIKDADQPDKVIVVKQGTTGQSYAQKKLSKAKIRALDKESACVLEVAQGKADAFLYDQLSIYMNWQKNLDTTQALLEPFAYESWAIGIRRGDTDLKRQVNAFLKEFHKNKGFEKLSDQYLSEQRAAFKKMGIPFDF